MFNTFKLWLLEIKVSKSGSKALAIIFLAPALVNLYCAIQTGTACFEKFGPMISQWNRYPFDYLYLGIPLTVAALVSWQRCQGSLVIVWTSLLICLWHYIGPVLRDPTDCFFCQGDSPRSTNQDHVMIVFLLLTFGWATYSFIQVIYKKSPQFSWPINTLETKIAGTIFFLVTILEISQGISAHLEWHNSPWKWKESWAVFFGAYFYAVLYAITAVALWKRRGKSLLIVLQSQLVGTIGIAFNAYWSKLEYIRIVLSVFGFLGTIFFLVSSYSKSASGNPQLKG